LLAFFLLFFVNNVFQKDVGGIPVGLERLKESQAAEQRKQLADSTITTDYSDDKSIPVSEVKQDTTAVDIAQSNESTVSYDDSHTFAYWTMIILLLIATVTLLFYLYALREKLKEKEIDIKSEKRKYRRKIAQLEQNVEETISKQQDLDKELKFRQSEMVTMAMSIIQKNEFLNELKKEIVQSKTAVKDPEHRLAFNKLSLMITQNLSIDRDREKFQMFINQQHSNFLHRLSESFPGITENEKRLAALLRLNLSSKEIASILNISPKSVEMNRYRLRKKLQVSSKVNLSEFIREF
jgi:DNA-binding CsgD family transcriptional regulator